MKNRAHIVLVLLQLVCSTTVFSGTHYLYQNLNSVRNDTIFISGSDTVTIQACSLTCNKPILINQNGVLVFDSDTLTLNCNIYAWENAQVTFKKCRILWNATYIYQYGIVVAGHASMKMDSTRMRIPVSAGTTIKDTARFEATNCVFEGTWTKSAENHATVHFTDCIHPFEILVNDSAHLSFTRCTDVLTWLYFPKGSAGTVTMPGDTGFRYLDSFYIGPKSSNISGIGYEVTMDSVTALWGCIPEQGCNVTLKDSKIRVMGFVIKDSTKSYHLNHLNNDTRFVNQQLSFPDRSVTLQNTYVRTFNLYVMLSAKLDCDTSVLGEVIGYHTSHMNLKNVTVDGSGGFFGLEGSAKAVADECTFSCGIKLQEQTTLRMNSSYCLASLTMIGKARFLASNSFVPQTPDLRDSSRLLAVSFSEPHFLDTLKPVQPVVLDITNKSAAPGDTFNLYGSAWYVSLTDTLAGMIANSSTMLSGTHKLNDWNTSGIAPGLVLIAAPVVFGPGDTLTAMTVGVKLTNVGIIQSMRLPSEKKWGISSNPHSPLVTIHLGQTLDCSSTVAIYDITGRVVSRLVPASDGNNIIWNSCDNNGVWTSQGWYVVRIETPTATIRLPFFKVR